LIGDVLIGDVLIGDVLIGDVLIGDVLIGDVLIGDVLMGDFLGFVDCDFSTIFIFGLVSFIDTRTICPIFPERKTHLPVFGLHI